MKISLNKIIKSQYSPRIACLVFLSVVMSCGNPDQDVIDKKVDSLISKMTIEEKIGQMLLINLGVISNWDESKLLNHKIDSLKLEEAVTKYHIGSIFNIVNHAFSVDHWHNIITQIQKTAIQKSRLGIPIIYGIDAVHGANYTVGATIFPHNIGMAATWNPKLEQRVADITAFEVRASGITWNFSPVLGVGRQPLWPRFYETFGEDPYLGKCMGEAVIIGLEGGNIGNEDKVAACVKHYIGYSFPLSGKDRTQAWIPERILWEYFIPSFRAAINAGAHTIMLNSGEVNGIPLHANHYLVTDVLRNELGFKGLVVSDWEDIDRLHTIHRIAETQKEAVRIAVMAGVDVCMAPYDFSFFDYLIQLVQEKSVPETRIDDAVRRILKLKFELGLFEYPYPNPNLKKKFACKEFEDVNLQAARESLTLLKNDENLLPLSKEVKVLVTGLTANSLKFLNGGLTYTWQGNDDKLFPIDKMNILQAVEDKIGKQNIIYRPGANMVDVIEAAKQVDLAIVCIGEEPYAEMNGNINDLTLPAQQFVLVNAIHSIGIPIVLVLVEGRPRIINQIVDQSQAIVMAYLPGMEGGRAIADVLFGDYNPCGKLPFTYPRYPNSLSLYDHNNSEVYYQEFASFNPQFTFGYGLSYTTFEYSNLKLDRNEIEKNDTLTIFVTVKNIGGIEGNEVVQLYVSDLFASITPPVKRLKRFTKVYLQPGESNQIQFTLPINELAFIGKDNKSILEPGEFKITIGNLTGKMVLN